MYQGEKSLVCSLSCTGSLAGFPEPSESWFLPLLKTWTLSLIVCSVWAFLRPHPTAQAPWKPGLKI